MNTEQVWAAFEKVKHDLWWEIEHEDYAFEIFKAGYRAALQSQDREGDPLQAAVNWLNDAIVDLTTADIQQRLFVGHNRAQCLLDHARRIEGDVK